MVMLYSFKVGGTEIGLADGAGPNLVLAGTKIEYSRDNRNGNTAKIEIPQSAISTASITVGDEVIISRGTMSSSDKTIFKGNIKEIQINDDDTATLMCLDILQKLKYSLFVESYDRNIDPEAGELSEIFKDIAENGGFTVSRVRSGTSSGDITVDKFISNNDSRLNRMNLIQQILNWVFYYDYHNDFVRLEPKGYTTYSTALTVGTNITNIPVWEQNIEEMRNKITVNGAAQLDTRVDNFTGDGSTIEFTLTYEPVSIETTVNGTLQTLGIDGSTTGFDYTLDKNRKTITFESPPAGSAAIVCTYTTLIPTPVTKSDPSSIARYGLTQEEAYDFEDVVTVADAEIRVNQLIDILKDGELSTVIFTTERDVKVGQKIAYSNPNDSTFDGTYVVNSKNIVYGEEYDILKIGTPKIDLRNIFVTINERLKLLEKGDRSLAEILRKLVALIRTRYRYYRKSLKIERRSAVNTAIVDHKTLGWVRDVNDEPDCSGNYNTGTWNGTGIDGDQYVNSTYVDTVLKLDLEENPASLTTVDDLSLEENDGTYKINMTALYDMTDGSGTSLTDNSVNSNTGTITGATWTTDHLGNANNALSFGGTDVVTSSAVSDFVFNDEITVFAWIYFDVDGTVQQIVNSLSGSNRNFQFTVTGNNLQFLWRNASNTAWRSFGQSISGFTNQWVFVAVTHKFGSSTESSLWINNTKYVKTGNTDFPITGATSTLRIGSLGTSEGFKGNISLVGLLKVVLTDDEIENIYNYTSVHKLTSPLVTKTDSNGNSITGYEFWTGGWRSGSGGTRGKQSYLELNSDIDMPKNSHCIYFKYLPNDDLSESAGYHNIVMYTTSGNAVSGLITLDVDSNTIKFESVKNNYWGPTLSLSGVDLDDGNIHEFIIEFNSDATRAYVDGILAGSTTANDDDTNSYFRYRTFGRGGGTTSPTGGGMYGVMSKPLIVNRILTETERTALFAGTDSALLSPVQRLGAAKFNGSDQYVRTTSEVDVDSISFAIYPTSSVANKTIFLGSTSGDTIQGDGSGNLRIYDGTNRDSSVAIVTNEKAVFQLNWTGSGYDIYKDNVFQETISSSKIQINQAGRDSNNGFTGYLDEVLVFNTTLTEQDRQDIIDNKFYSNHSKYGNCVLWWSMDNPLVGDRRSNYVTEVNTTY